MLDGNVVRMNPENSHEWTNQDMSEQPEIGHESLKPAGSEDYKVTRAIAEGLLVLPPDNGVPPLLKRRGRAPEPPAQPPVVGDPSKPPLGAVVMQHPASARSRVSPLSIKPELGPPRRNGPAAPPDIAGLDLPAPEITPMPEPEAPAAEQKSAPDVALERPPARPPSLKELLAMLPPEARQTLLQQPEPDPAPQPAPAAPAAPPQTQPGAAPQPDPQRQYQQTPQYQPQAAHYPTLGYAAPGYAVPGCPAPGYPAAGYPYPGYPGQGYLGQGYPMPCPAPNPALMPAYLMPYAQIAPGYHIAPPAPAAPAPVAPAAPSGQLMNSLLQYLPPPGGIWSSEERARWLEAASSLFDLAYGNVPGRHR